jgi:subfamily B ATP-binding cassette protein HlyB/CyaB
LPIDFFEHLPAGVINKHMQQGSQIREFLTGKLMATLLDLPALIIFLPILLYYSPTLTFIVIGVALLLGLIIGIMIGPYRMRLRSLYETEAKKQSLLVECIHGMRTIKTMNLESRRQEVWETRSADAISNYIKVGKIALSANTISQFIERGLTVTIVIVGSFLVFAHHMTVGELVAFNMLSYRVISPILQFIGMLNNYQEVLMSVEMLGVVMNRDPEQTIERGLTPKIYGEIKFENVSFRYPGTTQLALQNINTTFPAGSVIGIVGRSGSGKTTLSALIQGLYAPSNGAVCIDGHHIQDLDLSFFRSQIGVVSQEPFIFRGSIKDNIRMGRPGATFEDVVLAARAAGADEFISLLGKRYDTELEEGGSNLSGGQKQRLCIARVLLRDPRIIIFDEATSALDPESETIVIKNLRKITGGRTTIIISHRLVTIKQADVIVVIESGVVSDTGTHDELIVRNSFYRLIWSQQTGALS